MRAIIHLSAFDQTGDDEFIVKDLAIVYLEVNTIQSWIFQVPFNISELPLTLQLDTDYLATHIYRVQWNDGDVPYNHLQRVPVKYTKHISVLYAHGRRR